MSNINKNKNSSTLLGSLLFVMPFLLAGEAQAGIFKCVNTEGQTVYLDKPCPVKDTETEMKAVKDPNNGYIPPAFAANIEGENNRKFAKPTSESVPLGKSKKPNKPSEASGSGGNGSAKAGENNPSADRNNVSESSLAAKGSAPPPSNAKYYNNIEIVPLKTLHY